MDARGHIFNDKKWAANFGLGLRKLCDEVVYGGNFYWDWREAEHTTFHQLGAGLEALWLCWDIRINGYVPVNRHKKSYRKGFERFQENEAIVFKKWELSMSGFDGAVGYWLCKNAYFGLHASLGGYSFRGDFDKKAGGGLARAKVKLWDYFTLDGQISFDNLFKWQANGGLAFHIPLKPPVKRYPKRTNCCRDIIALEERIIERPERFEIIVTTTRKDTARALHPNTGDPLTFFFVNNTSSSLGTFESPFPTLAEAEAAAGQGEAIYVFQGDGTDTGMNMGITMEDRQILAGSGAPLRVRSRFGPITIPPQTPLRPKISNASDVITLANGNIISGLDVTGESIFTFFGVDTVGLYVLDNVITFSKATSNIGISISGSASGQLQIKNNIILGSSSGGSTILLDMVGVFNGHVVWSNNFVTLSSAELSTIMVTSDEFTGSMTAENNVFQAVGESGIGFSINAPVTADWTLDSNVFTTFGNGDGSDRSCGILLVPAGDFLGSFVASNNTFTHTATGAVTASVLTSLGDFQGTFVAFHNTITTITGTGTAAGFDLGIVNAPSNFTVSENTLNILSEAAAIGLGVQGTFIGNYTAQNNTVTVTSTAGTAVGFSFLNDVVGNVSCQNNTFNVNGPESIGVLFQGAVDGNFTAQDNLIRADGTGDDFGIGFLSTFSGNLIAEHNQISTKINSGLLISSYLGGELFVRNNSFEQLLSSTNPTFDITAGDDVDAVIQNNFMSHVSGTGEAFRFENTAGISHLKFFENDLSSPGAASDGSFVNMAGTLELESPNLQLSGVEAINEGRLTESGVTFVPFNP